LGSAGSRGCGGPRAIACRRASGAGPAARRC
jgi:hypothetical protein